MKPQAQGPASDRLPAVIFRIGGAAIETYAENPILRAVVVAIPFAGGALDALLGTAGSDLAAKRVRVLFDELKAALDRLADRLDQGASGEELQDAAIRAVRGAIETGDREKVRVLTAVLAEAGTTDRPRDLDFEAVLSILSDLSPITLRLGRELYDQVMSERLGIVEGAAPAQDFPDADFHVQRLEAAGLINRLQAQALLGPTNLPARWMPTPTFRRIMDIVRRD